LNYKLKFLRGENTISFEVGVNFEVQSIIFESEDAQDPQWEVFLAAVGKLR